MKDIIFRHGATTNSSLGIALYVFVAVPRPIQQASNPLRHIAALVPSALEKAEILRRGALAGKPKPVDIGAEVLVFLERHADGPVAVRPESPLLRAPARIREVDGFGDVDVREHGAEHGERLGLGHFVRLFLDAVRLRPHDRHEDDVRPFEEARSAERLPDRIVPAEVVVRVEEVLRLRVPERLVELEEYFRVCAHLELLDRVALPARELGLEFHDVVLQDTY